MVLADPTPTRLTVDEYLGLVARGQLRPTDRVELLEGVVVSMSPQNPPHAGTIGRVNRVLVTRLGDRATVRVQLSFLAGAHNVPEPDFAVVPGSPSEYDTRHPDTAHLIIEVADTSLPSDRLSKSRIYAAAGVPQYWIVNLPGDCVETFEQPDPARARYERVQRLTRGQGLAIAAFPDIVLAVDELLPRTPPYPDRVGEGCLS
jgi:Uma2 family endonuclease